MTTPVPEEQDLSRLTWHSFPCPASELSLDVNLACGQSFRWHASTVAMEPRPSSTPVSKHFASAHDDDDDASGSHGDFDSGASAVCAWTGVVGCFLVSLCRRCEERIQWSVHRPHDADVAEVQSVILDYLALSVNLTALYKQWSDADENFRKVASSFPGIRILRQDPVETLFSFICSSNNHISRISGMVQKLCALYGTYLATVDGRDFYRFPTVDALCAKGVEAKLRDAGFGYRAQYIAASARVLAEERKPEFLSTLRNEAYTDAHSELIRLPGVGPKVADCVCLMALDKHDVVPVDTHVYQVALRDYIPSLAARSKTLTPSLMATIGDFFRKLYGPYAGWAHSVLFSAELRKFGGGKKQASPRRKAAAVSHDQPRAQTASLATSSSSSTERKSAGDGRGVRRKAAAAPPSTRQPRAKRSCRQ
ncbi:N-glycosylase/DNA lyase-like [Sycon ciliatum]|uniref:N-glycosylase/DNA lyase-like n=1 Tax=Sycon ciliatum TaxID=27933 RepID=UPI0031F7102A